MFKEGGWFVNRYRFKALLPICLHVPGLPLFEPLGTGFLLNIVTIVAGYPLIFMIQ